ncbi:hypothetical protein [Leptospira idonii]|uniref:Uncharacterized protein n=1 Tax=Leptospira idonii TaxID=1193500 RepID=A0A4R9LXT0_9LEPT|nr:hypothetical protein [Leptospira idonii]TGN18235.1 hypothetical protein EHS15_12550 [Leptospira idonii]
MFTGHYAPAIFFRSIFPKVGLFHLFFAVQFLDYLYMTFLLLGIEKMRIVPGFTEINPYDLYYMPISHSLVGAFLWSAVVFLVYLLFVFRKWKIKEAILPAFVVGLCVFSHFALDLPMHKKDLPLFLDAGIKLGFGIWDYKYISLALENGLILLTIVLYAKKLKEDSKKKIYILGIVLVLMNLIPLVMPLPGHYAEVGVQALIAYIAFNVYAYYLDRKIEYV